MSNLEIVQQVKAAEPPETFQSEAAMLGFILRLLVALPDKTLGLVKAPQGGENVAFFTPANEWVRVNRVAYPNGQLIKVLMDSGPGGANVPSWNNDDIRPDLYIPVSSSVPNNPPPIPIPTVDLTPVLDRLDAIQQQFPSIHQKLDILQITQNDTLDKMQQIINLLSVMAATGFPSYTTRIFGQNITLTPKKQ